MNDQDKRAVESMCSCGLDLEGIIASFPMFPREEIIAIYENIRNLKFDDDDRYGICLKDRTDL